MSEYNNRQRKKVKGITFQNNITQMKNAVWDFNKRLDTCIKLNQQDFVTEEIY